MDIKKSNSSDNVSGFLDGYRARNIAILEDTLVYEVQDLEKFLYLFVEITKEDEEFKKEYDKLKELENRFSNRITDILSRLMEFGSDLFYLLDFADKKFILKYEPRIKQVKVKYIDICEKSKNQELVKRAIKIASKL